MNCFRYLGFTRLEEVETLTLYEYQLLMKAHRLKQVDQQHHMHQQAWLNRAAGATKQVGQKEVGVYKTYKEFFDYEAQLKQVDAPKKSRLSKEQKRLAKIAAQANSGTAGRR